MADIHDRMPVILLPDSFEQWLGNGNDADRRKVEQLQHLMRPLEDGLLEAVRVSKFVNNPMHEGKDCVVPQE